MFKLFQEIKQAASEVKRPTEQKAQGKILALMNQKGGVGKTTMAFNLAHALASQGKRVLCIDMDPQYNFSALFGVDPTHRPHIFHQLINSVKELRALHTPHLLSETIVNCETEQGYGVDVLPAGQELSGFELTVAGINGPRQLVLKRMIEKNDLRAHYDFIVIDGPPTLGLLVVNILCAVDGVLYPFVPDSFSRQGLKNIQQVLADIDDMGITQTPKTIGYIPNLFEARRKQVRNDFEVIGSELGAGRVFEPFANKVQFIKSQAARKSVFAFQTAEFKELQGQFLKMASAVSEELP